MLAIAMMEVAQNILDDLWTLSASVPVICFIMTTTFLLYILNFGHELPGNETVGIIVIFFAFSIGLTCIYIQIHKKFRACKNVLEEKQLEEERLEENKLETPNDGSSANSTGKEKEIDASESLPGFSSCVPRYSFPVKLQEEFSYRCDSSTTSPNIFARESLRLSKTYLKCAESKNSNCTSLKNTEEIPVILHNCVKGIDDVIEHVRLLNHAYVQTVEDTAVTKENSTTEERTSNSKFMDEEKSVQCKLQSTNYLKKLTNTSENSCSIPSAMSKDFGDVQKPLRNSKIDSGSQNPERLGFSKLLSENLWSFIQNVSEDETQEFLSKPGITVTDGPESFLIKIPSHEHQLHSKINLKPELDMGKKTISIRFYKEKPPVTQTMPPKVTVKRRIPKLPMRPYVGKITMSQFMRQRANSMERYDTIISPSEPTISKNLPTISKKKPVISVNELLISMNQALISDMDKPSFSLNNPMISKFERAEYEEYADALKDCTDYCIRHPATFSQYLKNPPLPLFPKWESHIFPWM